MRPIRSVLSVVVVVVFAAVGLSGCEPGTPRVTTSAGLYPAAFQRGVLDYVNRCDPSTPTTVDIDAPSGTTVSVDGSTPQSGRFSVQVAQQVGRRFTIDVTLNGTTTTHSVRCLPTDFPQWSAERSGTTQAQFYATVIFEGFGKPSHPVVFDTNGVPIWWLPRGNSYLLAPLPNRNFATITNNGMEERNLSGEVIRTIDTAGGRVDAHDVQLLPNGNYVLATVQPQPCDLRSWGLGPAETCLNHVFQELTPLGVPVWMWDTAAHIPVTETTPPWRSGRTIWGEYDPWHYNSVEYTGDGFVISFRHNDAIYKINQATGAIEWKLSGTRRPESLTIQGDPLNGVSGQHDARMLADNTLTLFDNGSGPQRQPRAVAYRIDTAARTATLIAQRRDPDVPRSVCCGSARLLPGGTWVTGWGGTNTFAEYKADGARVFRLQFGEGFVYRGLPLLPGQYSPADFRAGMDAQYG